MPAMRAEFIERRPEGRRSSRGHHLPSARARRHPPGHPRRGAPGRRAAGGRHRAHGGGAARRIREELVSATGR
jgi:hypothetical protein